MAKTTRMILLVVMITSAACTQVTPSAMTPYITPTSTIIATPTLVPTSTPSPSPMPSATFTPGQEGGFAPEVRLLAAFDVSGGWFLGRGFDWSPDSQAIVFFTTPEMTPSIARAPAFTPQRLTQQRGVQPVWSPDGDRIAFVGSREPEMHATIWVVQADGSGLRDLLPGERAIRSMSSGKDLGPWLDDRTLVFMDHLGTGIQSLVTIDVPTGEVEGVCSAQSKVSPPAFGAAYHWAPSLEAVVVIGYSQGPQMGLLQLLDQTSCRDIRFPRPSEFHAWAPSGDHLLFSHWEWKLGQGAPDPVTSQVPTLYIWNVIQDKVKWTGPEGSYEGALSPDGEHLAFFLLGNPRYEGQRIIGSDLVPGMPFPLFLVVLDIRTEEILALVPMAEITDFYNDGFGIWAWFDQRRPVWSPDGEQIVYWGEGDDLWVMRWDGTNQQRLTEGLDMIYAVWSPDGGRLAIATSDERLWIIERP